MTVIDESDVAAAVELAAGAVGAVGAASDAERAHWLRSVAQRLDAQCEALVRLADKETSLGAPRLTSEVARTTGQLRLFADVVTEGSYYEATIDHAERDAVPPRPDLRRMLRPLGTVAVYAASNFPFAFSVAGGDTASALAVGCPVIVKAHPGHPELSRQTAALVISALRDAGAPEGAFGLVEGYEAGRELIQHPSITAAAFTGSLHGGRALHDLAAARPAPIPFYGELGSINPVVVTRGADRRRGDQLARSLAESFQLGAGQFCTKPGIVFAPAGSVIESLLPDHIGAPSHRLLTPAIESGFHAGLSRLLALPGAEVIAGRPTDETAVRATVIAVDAPGPDDQAELAILSGEVFGPVTVIVRYRELAELETLLSAMPGSLTATIHSEPDEDIAALVARVEPRVGRLLFDGWPTGVTVGWAQHHGGPWPATTSLHTSVGASATRRFLRPVVYQDAPAAFLPIALRDENSLGIPRRVDGVLVAAE